MPLKSIECMHRADCASGRLDIRPRTQPPHFVLVLMDVLNGFRSLATGRAAFVSTLSRWC